MKLYISTPVIFHDSGEYEEKLTVPMFAEEGATIYYTTDDTEPTAASTEYTEPLNISTNTTLKAIAVKDGKASDVVERVYTIVEKEVGSPINENVENFYRIKNVGNDGYVKVAGRKTVTFVGESATETDPGTVIKVKTNDNVPGQVEILRSQGVDVPGYAERAMQYVPKIVQMAVDKLKSLGSEELLGSTGLEKLMTKFEEAFDYHLYTEKVGDNYRIYGKTPSMKHVVDFYAENKDNVDAKLPQLEDFINRVIDKVLDKTEGRGSSILVDFSLLTVWKNMGGTLTKPDTEKNISQFYTEVLSSEENVWKFAYETAMIYWGNLKENETFKTYKNKLGEYAEYIDKMVYIRPNVKYYLVANGSKLDVFSQDNEMVKNGDVALWSLEERRDFKVTFNEENVLNDKYYTTLYTDFAYDLPEDGSVKAYKVTEVNPTTGVAVKVALESVPAQTPVLIESESAEAQTLKLNVTDGTAPTDNLLVGADVLINQDEIKTAMVETLFDMAKEILGQNGYDTYLKEYEHLMLRNAGTVNNKYFFGLEQADIKSKENVRVLNLSDAGENLGFYSNWFNLEANRALIIDSHNPVKLFLKGDIDRDGDVDEEDLKALVEIVLGKVTLENNPDDYDFDAAHVNDDENINIADVTALVNILKPQPQD